MALKDIGARFVVQGESQFISSMGRADAAMDRVGGSAQAMGTGVRLGLTAIAAGATALGAGLLYAVNTANTFEQSFARVRKTVDGTPEELEAIKQAFIGMAQVVPVNVNELNRIGEAAGQLGIKKENIVEFTRVAAEMGVTTNLSSDQAAEGMARLANIISLPQEQFRALGSTIVDLGNNSAATESDILQMSLRLAGAGNIVGLTAGEILGMATALSSVGIEAESGGSAFSRVMIEIANSVKTGGDQLNLFAAVSGQTTAAFKKQFETDAAGAIVAFVKGLDNVNKAGGNVFAVLDDLELGEIRVRDALLRSAQAGDILAEGMARGNKEMALAAALGNESGKAFATTGAKLILAGNAASEASRKFGEQLQPAVGHAADAVIILINKGLIPLINEQGPSLARFLDESAKGWGIWADVITNKAVPATQKEAANVALLGEAFRIAGGLILGATQALANFAAAIGRESLGLPDFGAGGIIGGLATGRFSPTPRFEAPADRRAREAAAAALVGMGEKAERLDVVFGSAGEKAEILDRHFGALGEQAEITGISLDAMGAAAAGFGKTAGAVTPEMQAYLDRLNAIRDAMGGDDGATGSSKALSDATREEAAAARDAAEAERELAEALQKAKEAREAIINTITAGVLRNQAGVQLGSSENPRLDDFALGVSALEAITAAGGDASIAIALINRTVGEFSGVLSTLGGEDLAAAGAVMEGLHRLKEEFDAGRIGAEEYAAGLQGLTGDLGTYVTKALDAAETLAQAQKDEAKRLMDFEQARNEALINHYEAVWQAELIVAERRRQFQEEEAKREMALAKTTADFKLGLEVEAGHREKERRMARRQQEQGEFFDGLLRDVLNNPGSATAQQRLAEFVIGNPDFESRLSLPNPLDVQSGRREDIMGLIGNLVSRTVDRVAMPIGAGAGASGGNSTNFTVNANYSNPEEPQGIRLDLEALLMAAGR